MQVYATPYPLETKREENEKEKECKEEIFDTYIKIKKKKRVLLVKFVRRTMVYIPKDTYTNMRYERTFILMGALKLSIPIFSIPSRVNLELITKTYALINILLY